MKNKYSKWPKISKDTIDTIESLYFVYAIMMVVAMYLQPFENKWFAKIVIYVTSMVMVSILILAIFNVTSYRFILIIPLLAGYPLIYEGINLLHISSKESFLGKFLYYILYFLVPYLELAWWALTATLLRILLGKEIGAGAVSERFGID